MPKAKAGTNREAIKQYINKKVTDTMPTFSQTKNVKAIKNVLEEYNSTVGKLDVKSLATGAVLMSVSAVIVAINAGMLKVKDKS